MDEKSSKEQSGDLFDCCTDGAKKSLRRASALARCRGHAVIQLQDILDALSRDQGVAWAAALNCCDYREVELAPLERVLDESAVISS